MSIKYNFIIIFKIRTHIEKEKQISKLLNLNASIKLLFCMYFAQTKSIHFWEKINTNLKGAKLDLYQLFL